MNDDCHCQICGLDQEFSLPPDIIESAERGDLVIFAGAGISTESPDTFPYSVYDRAVSELPEGLVPASADFPVVMEAYEESFGRRRLVNMIFAKLDAVDGFRRSRDSATRFHRELATMPYIADIITTNWDTYFEEKCEATPFVTGSDIALWSSARRRVLKIHGSISNLGSIVATQQDYTRQLEEVGSNVLGAHLRTLLSSKTIVYIGYSLRDWNFRSLHGSLVSDMDRFAPSSYVVSPHSEDRQNDLGMTILKTSGVKFLHELKRALVGPCYVEDEAYLRVSEFYDDVEESLDDYDGISHNQYPSLLYDWMYHDGMRDCCDRILHRRKTGEYSDRHRLRRMIHSYLQMQQNARDESRYEDVAYIEGYCNVLMLMNSADPELCDADEGGPDAAEVFPPLHFLLDADEEIGNSRELIRLLEASNKEKRAAWVYARDKTRDVPEGMQLVHGPALRQ